jgi:hypothetical protein
MNFGFQSASIILVCVGFSYNFVCRVDMKLLYCGFNGFGQCPTVRASTVPHLTEYPVTGVQEVSVAWSCVVVLTGESSVGSIHPLPHTSSGHSAYLVKHRDSFTFTGWSSSNAVGLYSVGNWFESWLGQKLNWHFFTVFLSHSRQMQG